jgi:hypothetical protein
MVMILPTERMQFVVCIRQATQRTSNPNRARPELDGTAALYMRRDQRDSDVVVRRNQMHQDRMPISHSAPAIRSPTTAPSGLSGQLSLHTSTGAGPGPNLVNLGAVFR